MTFASRGCSRVGASSSRSEFRRSLAAEKCCGRTVRSGMKLCVKARSRSCTGRKFLTQFPPPSTIEVARLQEQHRARLTIQFDAADRALVEREPRRAFAIQTPAGAEVARSPLAALVSPLVLQDDGWIVPIQHGFARHYAIARLGRGDFRSQAADWKRERYAQFLELSRSVWDKIHQAPEHLAFTNWYAAVTTGSAHNPPSPLGHLEIFKPSVYGSGGSCE
jgi:hypothetical protein